MQGWATRHGNYSTELDLAQEFTRAQAIERCKLHHIKEISQFGCVPVLIEDVKAL